MYHRIGNQDCKIPLINLANTVFNVACLLSPLTPLMGRSTGAESLFPGAWMNRPLPDTLIITSSSQNLQTALGSQVCLISGMEIA